MKLKTTLGPRRDGTLPKITIAKGRAAANIEADAKGEYDVPNEMAQDLINTGNFIDPSGKLKPTVEPGEDAPAGHLIVNPVTGEKVDLDGMSKDELELFALDNFGEELDKRKSKDKLVAEIMGFIKKATEDDAED